MRRVQIHFSCNFIIPTTYFLLLSLFEYIGHHYYVISNIKFDISFCLYHCLKSTELWYCKLWKHIFYYIHVLHHHDLSFTIVTIINLLDMFSDFSEDIFPGSSQLGADGRISCVFSSTHSPSVFSSSSTLETDLTILTH